MTYMQNKNDKTIKMCILKILSEINLGIVMKVYFPENECANMKNNKIYFMEQWLRACLKKAFCKMCVTICGIFCPDEGAVAGYGN